MKHFKGEKPHRKMQEPHVTIPDGMSNKGKGLINKLVAKYGLKEKPDAKVG